MIVNIILTGWWNFFLNPVMPSDLKKEILWLSAGLSQSELAKKSGKRTLFYKKVFFFYDNCGIILADG